MRYFESALMAALALGGQGSVLAQTDRDEQKGQRIEIEDVLVIGKRDDVLLVAGSGTVFDQEQLDKDDHIDLHQILSAAPGIYVREEDGFGLRPNIGIRGATTDRSQKLTIMEDGVLIGPAPYSAPAAYYVPNAARIDAIEVLKGPATVKYGPQTVGGAINFVTRSVPEAALGEIDVALGSYGYRKAQGAVSFPIGQINVLLDAMTYGSDGFKELKSSDNTGFIRNDLNAKMSWLSNDERQAITVKIGYADEDANETYLGLTNADFEVDPDTRYPASALDNFVSKHHQFHLNYGVQFDPAFQLNIKAYRNLFQRAWTKFDGFPSGTPTQRVLTLPNFYLNQYRVMSGASDSSGTPFDLIDVTNNDRKFVSEGLQISGNYSHGLLGIPQQFSFGVRAHRDTAKRRHKPRSYLMTNGILEFDGVLLPPKTFNRGHSEALSVFLANEFYFDRLTLNAGLRLEDIDGEVRNRNTGVTTYNDQKEVMPSISLLFPLSNKLNLIAGIHQGFSPSGPGATGIDPESSTNYEFGGRYKDQNTYAELFGFYSDYSNLLGRCRVSDFGCDPGQVFSGGEVTINGLEVFGEQTFAISPSTTLRLGLTYTYTKSEFQSSFLSTFSQFGAVKQGDELPYLPEHLAKISAGFSLPNWDFSGSVKYQSEMREEPGQGPINEGIFAEDYLVTDLNISWFATESLTVYASIKNALDERAIISHRPFGARPNAPLSAVIRAKYSFL